MDIYFVKTWTQVILDVNYDCVKIVFVFVGFPMTVYCPIFLVLSQTQDIFGICTVYSFLKLICLLYSRIPVRRVPVVGNLRNLKAHSHLAQRHWHHRVGQLWQHQLIERGARAPSHTFIKAVAGCTNDKNLFIYFLRFYATSSTIRQYCRSCRETQRTQHSLQQGVSQSLQKVLTPISKSE